MPVTTQRMIRLDRYDATGNTFVVGEDLGLPDPVSAAKRLTAKHGVDGLLLMSRTETREPRMRIFNPDGSEAEMCGNGSRCAAHWAQTHWALAADFKMMTGAGLLEASVKGLCVKIRLTDVAGIQRSQEAPLDERIYRGEWINTGVPHFVIEDDQLEKTDANQIGSRLRHHASFAPRGTNVTFYRKTGPAHIKAKTYERGVEAVTLSCGTGSAAAALASHLRNGLVSPVEVEVPSGKKLKIYFKENNGAFTHIYLEGEIVLLQTGIQEEL